VEIPPRDVTIQRRQDFGLAAFSIGPVRCDLPVFAGRRIWMGTGANRKKYALELAATSLGVALISGHRFCRGGIHLALSCLD
jgi:hypothetical protein